MVSDDEENGDSSFPVGLDSEEMLLELSVFQAAAAQNVSGLVDDASGGDGTSAMDQRLHAYVPSSSFKAIERSLLSVMSAATTACDGTDGGLDAETTDQMASMFTGKSECG